MAQKTEVDFSNTEQSDHSATDGLLYYDKNYYPDFSELGSDGGGLAVYTNGQWGAVLSTENSPHMTPQFSGVDVVDGGGSRGVTLDLESSPGSADAPWVYWNAQNGGASYTVGMRQSGDTWELKRYEDMSYNNGLRLLTADLESGNVGVGTSSPRAELHVQGGSTNNRPAQLMITGPGQQWDASFPQVMADLWLGSTEAGGREVVGIRSVSSFIEGNGHLRGIRRAGVVVAHVQAGEGDRLPHGLMLWAS